MAIPRATQMSKMTATPNGSGKQRSSSVQASSSSSSSSSRRSSTLSSILPAVSTTNLRMHRAVSMFQDGTPESRKPDFPMFSFGRMKLDNMRCEKQINSMRCSLGLYRDYPLANSILSNAAVREKALKFSGKKQLNHVRGTDGWWRSMLVLEVRAIDNYFNVWCVIFFNAIFASVLGMIFGVHLANATLAQWDTVYSLVLKTSLAFLLVFRLNRIAMRFWETRTMWGNITHNTRNLVGGILSYGRHNPKHRDEAIKWASAYCVATTHFIRSDHEIPTEELAGFLTRSQIDKMQDANHQPLYAASMVRYHLRKIFEVGRMTPPGLAYAYATQHNNLEQLIQSLIAQTSGMERIRSTPLPIVYVTHLRTFLFLYLILLPYVWVSEWGWLTIPLVGFTAFALLGIEGSSTECEVPFDKSRPNHLAMDGYCLVILDGVQGLVVQDANLAMQEFQDEIEEEEDEQEATEEIEIEAGDADEIIDHRDIRSGGDVDEEFGECSESTIVV
mmetsp:Transcript_26155/g.72991  ORF Transcript_26155/g.72991 Transcript_26155/m.72991 type:complete len:502 (-) Transcript_26155:208-1713(-)